MGIIGKQKRPIDFGDQQARALRGTVIMVIRKKDCGNPEVMYKVEVKDNFFKLQKKMNKIIKIRSPVNSCDPRLEIGSEYLISGKLRGGFYYTDNCLFNQKWQTLSKDDKREFERGTFNQC
ncbi:uncharacterized protein LOC127710584 isoform X1 [Mytilus californianus]|uniref:uncharacterized protein LOC127710584 isoform X1 n=1 Tax=Mytilus californianus TaxID=6549 RepID=UPI002245B764|nr:uncharacterized protein LOC127710584 isoform X1 [Mytilus californianus]